MRQYLNLLQKVLEEGVWQKNRTGINTLMIPGAMLEFNNRNGFPIVTTKKLAFNSCKGELLSFLRGYDNSEDFKKMGCNFWDANANVTPSWVNNPVRKGPGDLGRIYGVQWNKWRTSDGKELNQLEKLIEDIKKDPTSRRLKVTAWRPDELHLMALPPCHYSFNVIIEQETNLLHLSWNQRSVDTFLGLPMNITSYAILQHILARITGYSPGKLIGMLEDVHIYKDHLDQVHLQLTREPKPLPYLYLTKEICGKTKLSEVELKNIMLINYLHHDAIPAPMAA